MNKSKRILIATDIPFLHLMKGNHNRIRSYYSCLKKQYNVDVLFFIEKEQNNQIFGENIYFYSDFLPKIPKSITIKQPYNISSKVKYEYKLAFDEFVSRAEKDYDYIIIPYIWLSYLIDIKPETKAKFIIDTHDSFSERTKSLAEHDIKFTSACTTEEEKFCLRNFDYIMAISDEERLIFESMGYNNVFTAKYFYKPKFSLTKLGIIGSGSIHNIDALDWFVNNIFKGHLDNNYQLYICGELAKNEEVINKYKGLKNIILYGIIWNIEDYYNLIDICINPVQIGSGLKIKNIEAISFNKPIITSTIGIQGMNDELDKKLIYRADNLVEWQEVLEKLSHKENLIQLKEKQEQYNLNNIDSKVYTKLIDIIEE